MKELLLELYSEEIPPQLQIAARSQIKQFIENSFKENNIKYNSLSVYSSPTRLTLFIKELAEKIKTEAKEIKGPKLGSPDQVIQGFLRAKNVSEKELIPTDLFNYGKEEEKTETLADENGFTVEIYQSMNSDSHKWYFYPKMNRDEVVMFKTYDSNEKLLI